MVAIPRWGHTNTVSRSPEPVEGPPQVVARKRLTAQLTTVENALKDLERELNLFHAQHGVMVNGQFAFKLQKFSDAIELQYLHDSILRRIDRQNTARNRILAELAQLPKAYVETRYVSGKKVEV